MAPLSDDEIRNLTLPPPFRHGLRLKDGDLFLFFPWLEAYSKTLADPSATLFGFDLPRAFDLSRGSQKLRTQRSVLGLGPLFPDVDDICAERRRMYMLIIKKVNIICMLRRARELKARLEEVAAELRAEEDDARNAGEGIWEYIRKEDILEKRGGYM